MINVYPAANENEARIIAQVVENAGGTIYSIEVPDWLDQDPYRVWVGIPDIIDVDKLDLKIECAMD